MMLTNFPEPKTHKDEEAIYIISGEGVVTIGSDDVKLTKGTAIYIPPNTPHYIKKIWGKPLKAVYCYSGNIGEKR